MEANKTAIDPMEKSNAIGWFDQLYFKVVTYSLCNKVINKENDKQRNGIINVTRQG